MTLGQSLLGTLFLVNMRLAWWEAAGLFVLWAVQFALSPFPGPAGASSLSHSPWVTALFRLGGGGGGLRSWPAGGAPRHSGYSRAMWDRHLRAGAIK